MAAIEEGKGEQDLTENAWIKVQKYLYIRHYGSKVTVTFNENAIAEEKKYHGYFALVSNCEKAPFECLRKYRKRETIEFFFESGKQRADGSRTRVWTSDALMGRMFVQFVALCYYEYLSEQIREMKQTLAIEDGNPEHDSKNNIKMESKLKSWLKNTPVYLILQWFDVIEEVTVSSKLHEKRWTTELIERDRMFLTKLGVRLS